MVVFRAAPYFFKRLAVDVTEYMAGILVIAAWYNIPVPGDHAGAPHAETGVVHGILYPVRTW